MAPEPLTQDEWSELRRIQAKPPGRRDDDEVSTLSDLTFRQTIFAMDVVVSELRPIVTELQASAAPDCARIAEKYRAPEIPSEPTVVYAQLPRLIAEVSSNRSSVSAAARSYTRLASKASRAYDRLRAVWAAHTPTDGPEWRINAEFAVVARDLGRLRDDLEVEAQFLHDLESDLHQTSISLRAIKDLAT